MNWVERRKQAETFIEENRDRLWRDLCNALEHACISYHELYNGEATASSQNGHQFRVTVKANGAAKTAFVDLTLTSPDIKVVCTSGPCKNFSLALHASEDTPYCDKQKELTADQVSEAILQPIMFPGPGVHIKVV